MAKNNNFSFRIENNNVNMVETELKKVKRQILLAWGIKWQGLVTKVITTKRIVDTGRLRASMDYRVGEDKVIVGTNVEYASQHELGLNGHKARPYIKPSVMNYKDTYKTIAESMLK